LRTVVALILIVAVGGVGYLVLSGGDGRGKGTRNRADEGPTHGENGNGSSPSNSSAPPPDPLPDIAKSAHAAPFSAATQKELAEFVAECRRRGAEAVPLLLQLLAQNDDQNLQPRWKFRKGELQGFPTLRAAYIAALRAIPGAEATFAMRELMRASRSAEESYLLATELNERGRGGWSGDLLRTALAGATPAALDLRREMVALATRSDPAEAALVLARDIPRGESNDDGQLIAGALGVLPLNLAISAGAPLVADADVTYRAKGHVIRAMLNRSEPEVFGALRDEVARNSMDKAIRVAIAYAAANSSSFFADAAAHDLARAAKDTAKADALRRQFDARMLAAEELISTALDLDLGSSSEMRAAAMRRTLAAHRKRFEGK